MIATRERGSVTVAAVAAVALAGVMLVGIARVGAAAVLRARADSAADAAALAAADALALGKGSSQAAADAATTARDNGARLVSCECAGTTAEVVVAVKPAATLRFGGAVFGRARADVDYGAPFKP